MARLTCTSILYLKLIILVLGCGTSFYIFDVSIKPAGDITLLYGKLNIKLMFTILRENVSRA